MKTPPSDLDRAVEVLAREFGASEIWLFGSTATDSAGEPSDIDLLVVRTTRNCSRRPPSTQSACWMAHDAGTGFLPGHRVTIRLMSTKDILLEVAEKLLPDATLADAIYELEFRQAVEEGLASLDRGERLPLEEARKCIPQWTSRYSSPTKP